MSSKLKGRERRDVIGQAYALTLLSPVQELRAGALRIALRTLRDDGNPLLRQTSGTHFARWIVIDELQLRRRGRGPERLASAQLLFTSVFDRSHTDSVHDYLTGLARDMPGHVEAIWSHCQGYPDEATDQPERFAGWLSAHQIHTGYFFAPYGHASVKAVREALKYRDRLREFAAAQRFAAPETIQRSFREDFADLQPGQ
jgi:hypothetical protein